MRVYDSSDSLVYDSGEVTSADEYHDIPTEAGLQYGVLYRWQVRVNDEHWGLWSEPAYFRCVLGAPTGLAADPVPLQAAIGLTWVGNPAAAGYHVYQRRVGASNWTRVTSGLITQTEYLVESVGFGQEYELAVVAVTALGLESELSDPVEATVSWSPGEWWIGGLNLGSDVSDWQPDLPWQSSVVPLIGTKYPGYQSQGPGSERIGLVVICDGEEAYQALRAELARPEPLALRDPYGRVRRVRPDAAGVRPTQMPAQNRVLYRAIVRLVEVAPSA